jgi:predicted HicB family RNase H-like nuclease
MSEKRFTVTLNPELIRQLKIEAAKQNIRVNKIFEELITEYLKKRQPAK